MSATSVGLPMKLPRAPAARPANARSLNPYVVEWRAARCFSRSSKVKKKPRRDVP